MVIVGLKCEYLSDPIGIGVDKPRFSWQLQSQKRNCRQSAYRLIVSDCRDMADKGIGNLWDSGKVQSGRQTEVLYSGARLASGQRCWWRLKCWDEDGEATPFSEIAEFETGLLESVDWRGRWIGGPDGESGLLFRKVFPVSGKIRRARAYICGLGYYELYLNGKKAGDHVLDPGWTDYGDRDIRGLLYPFEHKTSKRALYVTYDVTSMLREGINTVGVMLGNGWFNQHERNVEGFLRYGEPRFILQMNLDYDEDDKRDEVVSDSSWTYKQGPIVFNNIYYGEKYDARLEVEKWNNVHKDGRDGEEGWNPVKFMEAPSGRLTAQMSPPDRVIRDLIPVSSVKTDEGTYVFDMGVNFSGWVRLQAEGPRGTEIQLRFSEEVDERHGLDFESAGGTEQIQSDVYIMKGRGTEVYEPRFTWHTFRYVEVAGYPGVPGPESITGRVVHGDVASAGNFRCSEPLINQINELYRRTQLSNFHGGVPSDCPHRERLGYTGDGQVTAEACIYNFDMASFYTKWIDDISDAQNSVTGFVPHTAPFYGGGGGPAWGCAYVINTWCMYLYYGDRTILGKHYKGMEKWMNYLGSRTEGDCIIRAEEPGGWFLGDWCTPEEIKLPPELVSTYYYFKCAEIMASMAKILDFNEDAARYAELSTRIADAFNKEFLDTRAGRYSIGRQGADVFPAAAGIIPEEYRQKVLTNLISNIESNDFHFDTGIFATPLIMEVLSDNGMVDLALKVLTRKGFPGFSHMLEKGATTLWESWDGGASHCHPMFGGVSAWFYRVLAGINPDPECPGFERILFKPQVDAGLEFAEASLDTVRGRVSIEWHRMEDGFDIMVEVPTNSRATLRLPLHIPVNRVVESGVILYDKSSREYREGMENIKNTENKENMEIRVIFAGDTPIIETGSGKYTFHFKKEKAEVAG